MINWIKGNSAPKDGTEILACFCDYPPTIASWNDHEKEWAAASLQCSPVNGEWTDYYFETEYFNHSQLKAWHEI